MNFTKNIIFLALLCSISAHLFSMQKNRNKQDYAISPTNQLFQLARLAMKMSTLDQEKRAIYKKWKVDSEETPEIKIRTREDCPIDKKTLTTICLLLCIMNEFGCADNHI